MKNYLINPIIVLFLLLFQVSCLWGQDKQFSIELTNVSLDEYLANNDAKLSDIQVFLLTQSGSKVSLINGEPLGIPQTNSPTIVIFIGSSNPDEVSVIATIDEKLEVPLIANQRTNLTCEKAVKLNLNDSFVLVKLPK
jgi:hypothetical protein